jgi:hypothetical protein
MPLFAACAFGYLIGALHVATLREVGQGSAAEVVAQRFPKEWNAPPAVTFVAARTVRTDADLFRPEPMVSPSQSQASAEQPAVEKVVEQPAPAVPERHLMQTASLKDVAPPAAKAGDLSPRSAAGAVAKASTSATHPPAATRAGYILDDAQIASIKGRLHLTPDQ